MSTRSYSQPRSVVAFLATVGGLLCTPNLVYAPLTTNGGPAVPNSMLTISALATSADGAKLVAAPVTWGEDIYFGDWWPWPTPLYLSSRAGANWKPANSPTNFWQAVASAADGSQLVAVSGFCDYRALGLSFRGDGLIYISRDLGASWTATSAPSNNWSSVVSSADGIRLAAAAFGITNGGDGLIYVSTNAGISWGSSSAPVENWSCLASSADGTKLVATTGFSNALAQFPGGGRIFTSQDTGMTWSATRAPGNNWSAVTSSANGTRLVAAASAWLGDGLIYASTNSGLSWLPGNAPTRDWSGLACSAEGTIVAAVVGNSVYFSTNSGVTWTLTAEFINGSMAVALSADGYRAVVVGSSSITDGSAFSNFSLTLPYTGPWRVADAPVSYWSGVASSANGTKLVAVGDSICTSTDSGTSWLSVAAPSNHWSCVASSADGTKLVAASTADLLFNDQSGRVYFSADSGATWTNTTAPGGHWNSLASSADGAKLAAVSGDSFRGTPGFIYNSSDSGATWIRTSAPSNVWTAIASSADGTKMVAGSSGGLIYTSSDSGTNWAPTSAPNNSWSSIASAADGTLLAAASGQLYTSTNSGQTWILSNSPETSRVACSTDGDILVAYGSSIQISTNWGATWAISGAPPAYFASVAVSADGSSIVALGESLIYTLRSPASPPPVPPSPLLSVEAVRQNTLLSWLVPSTRFVLQQSSDLSSLNWSEFTNLPALEPTNLRYQLTFPLRSVSSFYRLKQQ